MARTRPPTSYSTRQDITIRFHVSVRDLQEKRKQEKALVSAALAAAKPPAPATPALSKGEIRVLETLYAVGPDAPPIRKQAIDFGLGLDAAGQLEEEGVLTSSDLTEANISSFQTRLKVWPNERVARIGGSVGSRSMDTLQRAFFLSETWVFRAEVFSRFSPAVAESLSTPRNSQDDPPAGPTKRCWLACSSYNTSMEAKRILASPLCNT